MDLCPDSALNILKGIPDPEKLRGESQATYALLMTQTMDKNYMKFSSDSLITIALNYYAITQNKPIMYAKTLFYHGRVMLELDKEEEALKSFLAAKDIYERNQNLKMLALIAEEIGMINRKQDLYDDALTNFREALTTYKQLKDSLSVISASLNIARVYLFKSEWDSCSLYYNNALEIAVQKNYLSEITILHELGILYRSMQNLSEAERYFLAAYEKETDEEKKYMECHHLVPLSYSYKFPDISLDVEENIVCLCSNCHNQLHYGKGADVLLKKLYLERHSYLEKVGIHITLNELLEMYEV